MRKFSNIKAHCILIGAFICFALIAVAQNVGVGTTNPLSKLHVEAGNLLVKGTFDLGDSIEASGVGTRFFFNPRKSSLRAGTVTGTQWDNANIGNYSVALGYNSLANTDHSIAIGDGNISTTSQFAMAFGRQNRSTGIASLAIGGFSQAAGHYSASIGLRDTVSGVGASALGGYNKVSGAYSFSAGFGNINSGGSSISLGESNTVASDNTISIGTGNVAETSQFAMAVGHQNRSTGIASLALGRFCEATGHHSVSIGLRDTVSGFGATAFGNINKVSGDYGFSAGFANISTGFASLAMGASCEATGAYSVSIGLRDTVSGFAASALGSNNKVSGDYGFSAGRQNHSTGFAALAMGHFSEATGDYSASIGLRDTVSGFGASALGSNNKVSGDYGFSAGLENNASGQNAAALGTNNEAPSFGELTVGHFATKYTAAGAGSPVATDRVFTIGNGTSPAARSDALVVLKNGNTGIGTSVPSQKLHVVGNICYTGSSAACSDMRYKTNVLELNGALVSIMTLRPIYYYWKKNFIDKGFTDGRQVGFSAQEVEKLYPEIIQTDADGYKAVDYSRLTPVIVKAMQEQQNEIRELRNQLKQLEKEMKAIKRKLGLGENKIEL